MSGGVDWWYELGSLVPSIGVGLLFWFAIRSVLRADRRERDAERVAEQEWAAAHPGAAARAAAPEAPASGARPVAEAVSTAPSEAARESRDA